MLDGLLNRGFSSKCKSLMKDVMKRLEVLRRRAEAKQRFLKEDLVKLLANGLDIDAYGRTEEFLAGLNLLSCYDFITYTCEYILKLLSGMQKQRECPEDCREAVASLMFAAARFSDLPELRDLRDLFQERYGSEMKCFVNQKFLEKLSSLPPAEAKRLQLLQDISTEFFIKWDCKAFEQRMAGGGSSTNTQQVHSSINNGSEGNENGVISKKSDASPKPRHIINDKEIHLLYHENPEKRGQEHLPLNTTRRKEQVHKREECRVEKNESSNKKDDNLSNTLKPGSSSSSRKKHMDITSTPYGVQSKNSGKEPIEIQNPMMMSDRAMHKEDVDGSKNNKTNVVLLPPYYVKSIHNPIPPPYTKPNKPEDAISKREGSVAVGNANQKQTDLVHDDNDNIPPLPRPRSVRKKQHNKSSAQYDDEGDDDSSNIKRSSSSRRKGNSRKGLQILFNDENHGKDEEERIMDKLLIHYSKKSSTYDEAAGKTRRRGAGDESNHPHPAVHQRGARDIGESSSHEHNVSNSMRSISLPNEQKQNVATEATKRFDRVQSFQPDNRASHVHPKLPEYDDLAAQFAALRGG